jgi:hypothetical protein
MSEVKQYEVYFKINIKNYPDRDDVPSKGKILIRKCAGENDAREKAMDRIVDALDINSSDIKIDDVIFWDHYYD